MLVTLPDEMREELRKPLGRISKEIEDIGDSRLITVGDIVTYSFLENDVLPNVSVVDRKTKREKVDMKIEEKLEEIELCMQTKNPAGTITKDLIKKLDKALSSRDNIRIEVDGEEDLATIPAIILSEKGDIVVYGQPGEGMVYVKVNNEKKDRAIELLSSMNIQDRNELENSLQISLLD